MRLLSEAASTREMHMIVTATSKQVKKEMRARSSTGRVYLTPQYISVYTGTCYGFSGTCSHADMLMRADKTQKGRILT